MRHPPVMLSLFEVLDYTERQGLDPLTRCTLDTHGRLRFGTPPMQDG